MKNQVTVNKSQCIVLFVLIIFLNTLADELVCTLYGGLGNVLTSDKISPLVFRSFHAWDSYIDMNFLSDTRTLPEIPEISNWKSDSSFFDNSIAVAFEGNRIARIVNVSFSEEKIIVNYELSEDEYTIIDYQIDPQGKEMSATAIVTYFISSESMNLKEKEVVFTLKSLSIKPPRPLNPIRSVQNTPDKIKLNFDLTGRSILESKACGYYIMKADRNIFKRIEIK